MTRSAQRASRPAIGLAALAIDRDDPAPLTRQLLDGIRRLIRENRLTAGTRLPASRDLAAEHGIARATVVAVYEQLVAEGVLTARVGRGTAVSSEAARLLSATPFPTGPAPSGPIPRRPRPFAITASSAELQPGTDWARAMRQATPAMPGLLDQGRGCGLPDLRLAIAENVASLKGLSVGAEQIVITSGHAESQLLIARTVFPGGRRVLVEDPGYAITRRVLDLAGCRVVPGGVDDDGLVPPAAGVTPPPDGAVMTPSRQFPLGIVMPIRRRLEWIDWLARDADRWLIEDDFDSELRYRASAPAALAALSPGRVIYEASFSRLIGRGLRLGFLVVPRPLVERIATIQASFGFGASLAAQAPLAQFLRSGAWPRHLRRLRRVLRRRFEMTYEALAALARDGLIALPQQDGGMHLALHLADERLLGRGDRAITAILDDAGITALPLSGYAADGRSAQGLVIGFANWPEPRLGQALDAFSRTLRGLSAGRTTDVTLS